MKTSSARPPPRAPGSGPPCSTGGPGTGKTTTVARLLALLRRPGATPGDRRCGSRWPHRPARRRPGCRRPSRRAADLTAEDRAGSASCRASTLHRLLGWRPDTAPGSGTTATTGCPYDVVVVDESSMVSLTLMARLLEAVRPRRPAGPRRRPRPARLGRGGRGARATWSGPAGRAGLTCGRRVRTYLRSGPRHRARSPRRCGSGTPTRRWRRCAPAPTRSRSSRPPTRRRAATPRCSPPRGRHAAAEAGRRRGPRSALDEHRLLCAHREGPSACGTGPPVERWLGEEPGPPTATAWYPGRPLLVTANDYALGSTTATPASWCGTATDGRRGRRRLGGPRRLRRPAGSTPSRPCTR